MASALREKFWIVDSLSTGEDFFTAHEHVVRVAEFVVVRVGHCVERTHREWVLVQDVVIGVVFCFDKFSEEFLVGRAEIVFIPDFDTVLTEHFDGFGKREHETRFEELERLARELLVDRLDFTGIIVP